MNLLFLDIETFSTVDLKKCGVYPYANDPSFEVLTTSASFGLGPVFRTTPEGLEYDLQDPDTLKLAFNANFERVCLSSALFGKNTHEYLDPAQFLDVAAIAAYLALPGKLETLAETLGTDTKSPDGKALIQRFSKPYRGKRIYPQDDPEAFERFCAYCDQDVVVLKEVFLKMVGGPKQKMPSPERLLAYPTPLERKVWVADARINDHGLKADRETVKLAAQVTLNNKTVLTEQLREQTGLEKPGSHVQMRRWLEERGTPLPNLQKDTVEEAIELARVNGDLELESVLEGYAEVSPTAVSKFDAILRTLETDDRCRGLLRYHGAHTGRWAGQKLQMQNLPRESFMDDYERDLALLAVHEGLQPGPRVMKKLIRPMFVGPIHVVDYSNIEARVVAWLAGEQWALDAFAAGRDIYTETAAMLGPQFTRQHGKVASLALGYQGGYRALIKMGGAALGDVDVLNDIKDRWRSANPHIVRLWGDLEQAFIHGGECAGGKIRVATEGNSRRIMLPSGRWIRYRDIAVRSIFVEDEETKKTKRVSGWSFVNPQGKKTLTYGGKLTENVTQAVARDIMAEALVRMVDEGIIPSFHVHDEVIVDESQGATLAHIEKLMCIPPEWSAGLPIAAEGATLDRYKKG